MLGAVTALIAARPLVAAGDPGRVPMSTATGHLFLTAGWFVVLAAWAVWNVWAKPGRRLVGWVGAGLIVTAILVAVRAAWAPDRWLAWRAAWDWLAAAAAFVVVRQLAVDLEDVRGLFAVVVATGVAALVSPIVPRLASAAGWGWPETAALTVNDFWNDLAEQGIAESIHEPRWTSWFLLTALPLVVLPTVTMLPVRWPVRLASWVPLALVAVAFYCLPAAERPDAELWSPAVGMIWDHPNGVGPGYYSRFAARYTPPESDTLPTYPPSYYLGLAATCGLAAAISLLVTLAILVRQCWPYVVSMWKTIPRVPPWLMTASPPPPVQPRWEFYFGGIAGLLIGFVLQVGDLPPGPAQPIRELGVAAAFGGLCWFVTFAIADASFRLIPRWPIALPLSVFLIPVVSLPLDLLSAPDIALMFWVLAALTLGIAVPHSPSAWARSGVGRLVPVLVAVPLAVAFVALVAVPGVTSAWAVWQARLAARGYPIKVQAIADAHPLRKNEARAAARRYIDAEILRPLAQAVRADPAAAGPLLEQVRWWLAMWELGGPPATNANALTLCLLAQSRDPEGPAGYLAELRVCLRLAELSDQKRKEQMAEAEHLIAAILRRDPARAARLRFQVARTYFAVKDTKAGRSAAEGALQLDADAPGPRYRLRDDERAQLRKWLDVPKDEK